MLVELAIENLAVVDSVVVEPQRGFTVLTGETGAGKSILIDALLLALGERADTSAIRSGAQSARITAVFTVNAEEPAGKWLAQEEIEPDDGLCIMRRTLHRERPSRCTINGNAVSAGSLRDLGRLLVDIQGQHAHQSLFLAGAQRRLLDQFAGLTTQAAALADLYAHWRDQATRLAESQSSEANRTDRLELVTYHLQELEELGLQPGEWEVLDAEQRRLSNARTLAETAATTAEALRGSDGALLDLLQQLISRLDAVSSIDDTLTESRDLLAGSLAHAQEAARSLTRYVDGLEFDSQRVAFVEDRVSRAHELARKHEVDAADLCQRQTALANERDTLAARQEGVGELQQAVAETLTAYRTLADEVSAVRHRAAGKFATVTTQLARELGMPAAQLVFEVNSDTEAAPTPNGYDQVSILFTANSGEPPRPLAKVASGGELSRLSLALHLAAADDQRPGTMIFDEVDAGIGGTVAHRVGAYLKQLATESQVLCVTHQPQVAAQGEQHLGIRKMTRDGRTTTEVVALTGPARRDEIARMLAGAKTSKATLQHAAELLGQSAQTGT